MPKIPTVVFDIDGVLADFTTPFTTILNELQGTDHPKDWPCYDPYGEGKLFCQSAWDKAWDQLSKTSDFWLYLPIQPDVAFRDIEYLMKNQFINGYFVTKRQSTLGKLGDVTLQTRTWLSDKGIASAAGVIAGKHSRVDILRQLDVDYYLDDYGEQFQLCRDNGINAYLIDRTYNRHIDAGEFRVYSIAHFLDEIQFNKPLTPVPTP